MLNTTFAFTYLGGRDSQLSLTPAGGTPMNAGVGGITHANGRWTLGAVAEVVNSQGDARLVGLTQRHELGAAFDGNYRLAPGLQLVAEYQYLQRHQGGYNFTPGTVGSTVDARRQVS
jgi:hypothetical protein